MLEFGQYISFVVLVIVGMITDLHLSGKPMLRPFINNILLKQLGKIPKQIILSLLAGRNIYKRKREKIKIYK